MQKALQAYRGTPLKLVVKAKKTTIDTPAVQLTKEREDKQQAAVEAINSDHNIQALKEHFDAQGYARHHRACITLERKTK